MIVHICCSVDSHFFIEKLKDDFKDEKLIGFFYDPNIHPYSEYLLRLKDAKYSCDILGVEFIEGEYALDSWLQKVRGFEHEPEKGERCSVCFDDRLEKSAKKAIELGHTSFTTTLLVSPKKSQEKLEIIGKNIGDKYNLEFIFKDYRSGNGIHLQSEAVKTNKLYRQDYCGCMFALGAQREQQNRLLDELMSPISRQILPNSIEHRLSIFEQRDKNTTLHKEAFLNYRLLNALVSQNKKPISAYILAYSLLPKNSCKCRVEFNRNEIYYANKDGVKFISIKTFNMMANSNFTNVQELYFGSLSFDLEIQLRAKISPNPYDISPIIVLDEVNFDNYEIYIDSKIYQDSCVKEV